MSCSHAASTSSRRSPSGTAAATDRARAATARVWSQRSLRPSNKRRASSDGSPAPPTAGPPRFASTSRNGTPARTAGVPSSRKLATYSRERCEAATACPAASRYLDYPSAVEDVGMISSSANRARQEYTSQFPLSSRAGRHLRPSGTARSVGLTGLEPCARSIALVICVRESRPATNLTVAPQSPRFGCSAPLPDSSDAGVYRQARYVRARLPSAATGSRCRRPE